MSKADTPGNRWRRELAFPLGSSAIVAADQLSKWWVRCNMAPGQSIPEEAILRLTYVRNTGAAFGLLANQNFLIVVTAVVAIAVILMYYRYSSFSNIPIRTGLGLVLGGAVGNLIDRLRFGHVIDFIDLRVWPVFNLADSAIVVGVIVLACSLFWGKKGKTG